MEKWERDEGHHRHQMRKPDPHRYWPAVPKEAWFLFYGSGSLGLNLGQVTFATCDVNVVLIPQTFLLMLFQHLKKKIKLKFCSFCSLH